MTDLVSIKLATPNRLVRVFPRRTKASPDDALAYFGPPDLFAEADEVHIDCTFTADKPRAEALAEDWRHVAPVKVGGVAYGDPGHEFVAGRYIKHGYTFTSRGCPRRCWFCSVWKRDPVPRLLPIQNAWNILDDNLLACPEPHVRAVFAMLWSPEVPSAERYRPGPEWRRFQRTWARPAIIHARLNQLTSKEDNHA